MNDEQDLSSAKTRAAPGSRCAVDAMEAIYARRSVRAYTNQRVGQELVHALIDAALQAPSAVNQQPWSFVVIQDVGMLRRFSDRAKELSLANLAPGTPMWEQRKMLADPDFNIFYDAGTLIAICATPGLGSPNEDCCMAAQNLMLAAHALGLATCPIGLAREALNEARAKLEFKIPADHSVVIPILVGYPRELGPRPPRREAQIHAWK